ncbi:hypothetical protein OSB04_025883 [Centaurea solstitialis]|uniref:ADP-ribosylation factor n=1 Tax=Centaurea solstitialis TaxID=347529 RepID=A0AA38T0H2_9ASTR|nr:hypothetical protein OSB04_025883 [Centaurea solstitialis]
MRIYKEREALKFVNLNEFTTRRFCSEHEMGRTGRIDECSSSRSMSKIPHTQKKVIEPVRPDDSEIRKIRMRICKERVALKFVDLNEFITSKTNTLYRLEELQMYHDAEKKVFGTAFGPNSRFRKTSTGTSQYRSTGTSQYRTTGTMPTTKRGRGRSLPPFGRSRSSTPQVNALGEHLKIGGSEVDQKLTAGTSSMSLKVVMLGLDAAGKTTILYKLHIGEVLSNVPTIGFNVEKVQYKNVVFTVWDVGGQMKLRFFWRHYFNDSNGLVRITTTSVVVLFFYFNKSKSVLCFIKRTPFLKNKTNSLKSTNLLIFKEYYVHIYVVDYLDRERISKAKAEFQVLLLFFFHVKTITLEKFTCSYCSINVFLTHSLFHFIFRPLLMTISCLIVPPWCLQTSTT